MRTDAALDVRCWGLVALALLCAPLAARAQDDTPGEQPSTEVGPKPLPQLPLPSDSQPPPPPSPRKPPPSGPAESPSRFLDVSRWELHLTVKCEGDLAAGGYATKVKDSVEGSARLETNIFLEGAVRTYEAPFQGNASVEESLVGPEGAFSTSQKGSGALAKGAKAKFEVNVNDGFYSVSLVDAEQETAATVTAGGQVLKDKTPVNLSATRKRISFPDHGMELKGSLPTEEPCVGPGPLFAQFKRTLQWTLKPLDDSLRAVPSASAVVRGETVTLDGSKSTGHPDRFLWKIEPLACPGGAIAYPSKVESNPNASTTTDYQGPTAPAKTLEGKSVSFIALCDFKATLEVSSRERSVASEPLLVSVQARAWSIEPTKPKKGGSFKNQYQLYLPCGGEHLCLLGLNYCAIDEEKIVDHRHWLHHSHATPGNYEGKEGFTVGAVPQSDPGPFAGMSYVKEHHLRIARAEAVNSDLVSRIKELHEQGPAKGWKGALKKKLSAYNKDYQRLVTSVREHEATHTRLAMEAFAAGEDPARLIEWMVGDKPEDVALYANMACGDANRRMLEGSTETLVHQALQQDYQEGATVLFPMSPNPKEKAFGEFTLPSLAGAGDDDTK